MRQRGAGVLSDSLFSGGKPGFLSGFSGYWKIYARVSSLGTVVFARILYKDVLRLFCFMLRFTGGKKFIWFSTCKLPGICYIIILGCAGRATKNQ